MSHEFLPPRPRTVVITAGQAQRQGITRGTFRGMGLRRVMRGVYVDDRSQPSNVHPGELARDEHIAIALALSDRLGECRFFSHETAAALWGLPIRLAEHTPITIGTVQRQYRLTSQGIRSPLVHPELAEVTTWGPVRLTSPAATWALLAPRLSRRDAVSLGDAVVRAPRIGGTRTLERRPFATLEQMDAAAGIRRRKGKPRLQELLAELSPHSASPPESHLRLLLTDAGLRPEALDFDVLDRQGRFIGCSEIAYPTRKVAVEYEGDHHRLHTPQWNRDITKYAQYTASGWRVVRVTAQMLYREPDSLCAHVRDLLCGDR